MTKYELLNRLRNTEETLLLELLDVNSDDLVDAFLDKINDRFDYISQQLEEDFSEE